MSYLKIDMRRLFSDKKVILMLALLLFIAILDPLTVRMQFSKYPDSMQQIGENPFQFWLLMNSVSWGNTVYNTMFWIFSVLFTGLMYYQDKRSSMYLYSIVRKRRSTYLRSKIAAVFLCSFVSMFLVLEVNVMATYTLFPDTNSMTDYYKQLTPHSESFIYPFFQQNPIQMVHIYTFLNAFTLSLFAVFSLCIHMLFKFSNPYVALLVPVVVLYGITFLFDSYPPLFPYNIRMILQPQAVIALSAPITHEAVLLAFGGWSFIVFVLIAAVFLKSRDVYE